ncbi:MAG UNVERIFIED_CONTAM: hypothetical protein LVR29_15590, partial [Microcystis novacekii LVE1205-3]
MDWQLQHSPAILTSNLDSQQPITATFRHPVRVKSKAETEAEAQPDDWFNGIDKHLQCLLLRRRRVA